MTPTITSPLAVPVPLPGLGGGLLPGLVRWVQQEWSQLTADPAGTARAVAPLAAAAVGAALAVAVVSVVTVGTVRRLRAAAWQRGARWVTVLAPPSAPAGAAEAFWAVMLGTLRPWRRRWWAGQPHLGFDYYLDGGTATIRLWVPGPIPAGQVERAVTAAWPGARTHTVPA